MLEGLLHQQRLSVASTQSERARLSQLRSLIDGGKQRLEQVKTGEERAQITEDLALVTVEAEDIEMALPFLGRSDETLAMELEDAQVATEELQEKRDELQRRNAHGVNSVRVARLDREIQAARDRALTTRRELNRRQHAAAFNNHWAQTKERALTEALKKAKADYIADLRKRLGAGQVAQWEVVKAESEPIPPKVEAIVRAQVEKDLAARLEEGRRMQVQNMIARGRI